MSAILIAKSACGRAREFVADLQAHLMHGFVYSTPTAFFMGRPVEKGAAEIALQTISWRFEKADCWFVWSAAGKLRELLAALPFHLPWMAFHRHGLPRLRVYRTARLCALAELRRAV